MPTDAATASAAAGVSPLSRCTRQAGVMQGAHGVGRAGLDGVVDVDGAQGHAVGGHEDRRAGGRGHRGGQRRHVGRSRRPPSTRKLAAADEHDLPAHAWPARRGR